MLSTFDLPSCREGGLADQLEGSAVRFVGVPRDLTELCELMRAARARDLTLVPRGSGSKFSWLELPVVVDLLLDLRAFDQRRYDRDTQTVTLGAATRVAVAQDELARLGRRLALDAPSPRASIGGVAVAGELGPLHQRFGPPAAQVTDATVVLPDGTVTRVAERVQLLGGSICDLRWAYPGWPNAACAVVDVTLQTHPLPGAQAWVTFPVGQPLHLAELREEILAANLDPVAMEIDLPGIRPGAVPLLRRHATAAMSVLFEGSEANVLDRCRALTRRLERELPHVGDQAPPWWGRYPFRPGEVAVRLHVPDGRLHAVCYALADAVGTPVPVRGNVVSGYGWAALPADLPSLQLVNVLEAIREVLLAHSGTAVVQVAPYRLREVVAPYRHP